MGSGERELVFEVKCGLKRRRKMSDITGITASNSLWKGVKNEF
jgi:hypothetical protein